MKPLLLVVVFLLCSPTVTAQHGRGGAQDPRFATYRNHDLHAIPLADSSLYKRRANWRQIVDQFWGPGLPRSGKQQVFDTFADYIHDIFPGFGGLNINWDSLRAFYAQQITDSTSRGGFSLILSRLSHDMHDLHVMGWDTIMQTTPLNPGVPIFALSLYMGDVRHFGAVLTPLPDSSLLVVRAVAGHPLNLQPGDIIVGYEGVPWKRLVFELLDSPLPQMGPMGSSESARMHQLLVAAGVNWHLFDTIDVIRRSSGALEHLPTAPLSSLNIAEYMPNNEQLSVASVPQPDYEPIDGANTVSYGVVGGTNIGYIYISGHGPGTRYAFGNAVAALMETDGLIIDIRWNSGGYVGEGPEAGLALLMNYSTQTLIGLERSTPADLYTLKPLAPSWLQAFSFDADPNSLYDRPIAVLIGPFAISQGDLTAYKFRFLPGARFFGRSVHGAASGFVRNEPVVSGFHFVVPFFVLADHREPNVVLLRKEFPVDDPVWLNADDVANSDDTVVKKARHWITSVAHIHGVAASSGYCRPGADTIRLTARVENPQAHPVTVTARFVANALAVDSIQFADDGQHGDGAADDGLWGTSWIVPAGERFYSVTTGVTDPADTSTFPMPHAARFTTVGPIVCVGDTANADPAWGRTVGFRLKFMNQSSSFILPAVTAALLPLDTASRIVSGSPITVGDIQPGQTRLSSVVWIAFSGSPVGGRTLAYALEISSSGLHYWHDTLEIQVGPATELATLPGIPDSYSLRQNYPNPFNPTTTISYHVPRVSLVRLSVFDVLGREAAVLVDERREAGVYEVCFDAAGFASGVYVYRLQAGDFIDSKKLVVIR